MAPTSGNHPRRARSIPPDPMGPDAPESVCPQWVICADLGPLGWTAISPCGSCVVAATSKLDGRVRDTGNRAAGPARLVTADELDVLLSQARRELPGGSTS